jgi:hypothetical protein
MARCCRPNDIAPISALHDFHQLKLVFAASEVMTEKGVSMPKKIGLLVGRENTWPHIFIEEVNRRNDGVIAELVKLAGTRMAEPRNYDVIVDRISHAIPYYRTFLKTAVMNGTIVINNPFWWSADDKFTAASIATYLGVAHPRTVALPSYSYIEGIVPNESLGNLAYPIPWEKHIEYVGGFPVILKPSSGGGSRNVYKIYTLEQLLEVYIQTGSECMMLQEFIAWDKYVRCFCIGQEQVLTMKFDINVSWPNRYVDEPGYLTAEEDDRVVDSTLKLCRAIGYNMNACEFALMGGIPYAIDFTNPVPELDYWSLKERFFGWVVRAMADFCIAQAKDGRSQLEEIHWSRLINPQMLIGTDHRIH